MTQKLDWTELGKELRQNSIDAHGEIVDVRIAYGFLLCNSECFLGDDVAWPDDMPQEPNIELIAAYYGVTDSQARIATIESLDKSLSGTALMILENVLNAMQDAEEIWGPDPKEYVPLMEAIACEAQARIAAYRENQRNR